MTALIRLKLLTLQNVHITEIQCWQQIKNPVIQTFKNVQKLEGRKSGRRLTDDTGNERRLTGDTEQFNCVLSETDVSMIFTVFH
jgi:hypothetical protein